MTASLCLHENHFAYNKHLDKILYRYQLGFGLLVSGPLGTGLADIIYDFIVEQTAAVSASSVTYVPR